LDSSQQPKLISLEEVKQKWINRPKIGDTIEEKPFSLDNVIPLLVDDNCSYISLYNDTPENGNVLSEDEVYITEQELQRIWLEASVLPFGKPMESFNIEQSLLLLPDDDDDNDFYINDVSDIEENDVNKLQNFDMDSTEDTEIFVTSQVNFL
jgi:hypothetical protein